MNFLKYKVWPVIAGFIVASIVMLVFEYINSFFFPIPVDMDWSDPEAVRALTASMPWTAYILVLVGWIVGSFAGGYVVAHLSHETRYRASLTLGILLTLGGIANAMMLGHPVFFNVIGLPMFLIFTYFGYLWGKREPYGIMIA